MRKNQQRVSRTRCQRLMRLKSDRETTVRRAQSELREDLLFLLRRGKPKTMLRQGVDRWMARARRWHMPSLSIAVAAAIAAQPFRI